MSDKSSSDRERVVRSFNFDKIVVERTHRGIEAKEQNRMHKFQTGMESTGRPRPILEPINEAKARLLYEALFDLLDDDRPVETGSGQEGDQDD